MLRLLSCAAVSAACASSSLLSGSPVWASDPSGTSGFVLLRSPAFTLRAPAISATLFFAAEGSGLTKGTLQAKLLGAASIHVNSVLVTSGPGHNVPTASQVVRGADVAPFLRGGGDANVVGIAARFDRTGEGTPRVQAMLTITDADGAYTATATGASWSAWAGDQYLNPTGDAGISWYHLSNEFLDRRVYPLRWAEANFTLPSDWAPAVELPPWPLPLLLESGAPPAVLVRSACRVAVLSPTRFVLDYGQEMMGGVNLSFTGAAAGTRVTVTLAEELRADGTVLSPARTGNAFNSSWTLAGDAERDAGITQHEFIQFRYAQVDGAVRAPTAGSPAAGAWVIQHAAGGTGRNPWESACAQSTPASDAFGSGSGASAPLGAWSSSAAPLDTVFNFSAYTLVATSLDVNVDGQTRERDVDIVDALNTELGQFYVFGPGDTSIQRRTLLEMFTNDTGMWGQWFDFKTSSVLSAREYVAFTGDVTLASSLWSDDDAAILADGGVYNSMQFEAGLRYFNASGRGLLHFPAKGNACGGSWSCDPLVDWPVGTRDGYDCSQANSDDTVRSAFGALAYEALGELAGWLGKPAPAARYLAMAAGVRAALVGLNLRQNGSEAFFVDGGVGAPASHAAVHSTLYAIAAGAADGDGALASALTAFLRRRGVSPSSCMMGRWWVTGLYRIGVWSPAAADLALEVLTAPEYPSWLDMIAQGATTTMEAWRPADKSNLDWAHPWCASPAFTIPSGTLGAMPLEPGWARWRLAPQPSTLTSLDSRLPTPAGMLALSYRADWSAGGAVVNMTLTVAPGQRAQVCAALPGAASEVERLAASATSDVLTVDGAVVVPTAWGRFACAPEDLTEGAHSVTRVLVAAL